MASCQRPPPAKLGRRHVSVCKKGVVRRCSQMLCMNHLLIITLDPEPKKPTNPTWLCMDHFEPVYSITIIPHYSLIAGLRGPALRSDIHFKQVNSLHGLPTKEDPETLNPKPYIILPPGRTPPAWAVELATCNQLQIAPEAEPWIRILLVLATTRQDMRMLYGVSHHIPFVYNP